MTRATDKMGEAMGKMKGAKQRMTGGAGIFERLAKEHGEISTMIRRVGASTSGSDVRSELFPRIKRELLAHAKAEEQEVYSVLRTMPGLDDKMKDSKEEHAEIERMLEELDAMPYDHEDWFGRFHAFSLKVQKHVIEEEQQVFPRAKDALSREQSEALEERFSDARESMLQKVA